MYYIYYESRTRSTRNKKKCKKVQSASMCSSSRPPGWPRRQQRRGWSYDQTPQYRVNDAPLFVLVTHSCSPARQAKHRCYVINVCAVLDFVVSAGHSYTCVLAYVRPPPLPRPLHWCSDCWRRLFPGNSGWSCHVLSGCRLVPCSLHAAAIGKQRTYLCVNSRKLD